MFIHNNYTLASIEAMDSLLKSYIHWFVHQQVPCPPVVPCSRPVDYSHPIFEVYILWRAQMGKRFVEMSCISSTMAWEMPIYLISRFKGSGWAVTWIKSQKKKCLMRELQYNTMQRWLRVNTMSNSKKPMLDLTSVTAGSMKSIFGIYKIWAMILATSM